ncbi:MAG: hypothetical protein R2854_30265 [Caldilineaceae bacterium]
MNTPFLNRRLHRTVLSLTLVAFLFAGVLPVCAETRAAGLELPAGFYVRATVDGLAAPTDLAALPDGRLLVTEKGAGTARRGTRGHLWWLTAQCVRMRC